MKKRVLILKIITLVTFFFVLSGFFLTAKPSYGQPTPQPTQILDYDFNYNLKLLKNLFKILFSFSKINLNEFITPYPTISFSPQPTSFVPPSPSIFPSIRLNYYIPFRDPTINPSSEAKEQILASWPNSQIQYYDLIVSESIKNQWNPAFVLTLWVEETGASTRTKKENGGSGIPTSSGTFSRGHLGCAPHQDQTINESLNCLFKNFSHFSNNQFADFMARYSGGPPENPFANNPNFPKNIKYWYSKISSVDLVSFPTPTSYFPQPQKTGQQYFAQCDPRWGDIPLPDGPERSTICKAGCGPTTTAMIVSSLTNNYVDPPSMVNFYKENGKYIGSNGSIWSDNVSILKSLGLTTTEEFYYNLQPAEVIIKDIAPYIKNGWTFFALANFCSKGCGHYFWIVDVGSVWAYDPYYGNGKSVPFDETAGPFPKGRYKPLYRRLIGVR